MAGAEPQPDARAAPETPGLSAPAPPPPTRPLLRRSPSVLAQVSAIPALATRLEPRGQGRGGAGSPGSATYLRPAGRSSRAALRASPGGQASSRPGPGRRTVSPKETEQGRRSSGGPRSRRGGWGAVRAATGLPLAPPSPRRGLRGLRDQKRKRGFSKVKEETKKVGQARKERSPARCEQRGASNTPSAFRPNSSRGGLTVCAPRRAAGKSSGRLLLPPGEPARLRVGVGPIPRVWRSVQRRRGCEPWTRMPPTEWGCPARLSAPSHLVAEGWAPRLQGSPVANPDGSGLQTVADLRHPMHHRGLRQVWGSL